METTMAVILAAGKSTRMKSDLPKVLHPICGRPMIEYVLDSARAAGAQKLIVIVGHRADLVQAALQHHSDVVFAHQTEQKGTGHAVMMAESHLQNVEGDVLVLAGDTPLLKGDSLRALLELRSSQQAACVIGTADTPNNHGLGRVVRNDNGAFAAIVEQKDASPEQQAITEINTGCYAFDTQLMLRALKQLQPNNSQAEYYLTDAPSILQADGHRVEACCSLTLDEALGVNTRVQLAEARTAIQQEILRELMLSGVTVEVPEQTIIDYGVQI
ncbi:MAG: NTP transferase domain-containing protein, partial [Planctomycetaceae bacterium]